MHPGWSGNEAFELPLCVDVKDEAAPWRQMAAHCGKHSLPVGEAPYVVNRIEYTDNHVESAIDSKVDHHPAGRVLIEALSCVQRKASSPKYPAHTLRKHPANAPESIRFRTQAQVRSLRLVSSPE